MPAEATSQLSASRRYMSRKPQGEPEKPQDPAPTAGTLGYKGAPTLKTEGGAPAKAKADPSLAPHHARERVLGSRLLGMTMGWGRRVRGQVATTQTEREPMREAPQAARAPWATNDEKLGRGGGFSRAVRRYSSRAKRAARNLD